MVVSTGGTVPYSKPGQVYKVVKYCDLSIFPRYERLDDSEEYVLVCES